MRPKIGDRVKVKLIAKTANDEKVFLNCDQPIEYNLFTGENIRGLDLVISTMIRSELCEASIAPEYVVEDLFNEDQIPKGERLLYTVELLDWENEYLTRKNDGGVIRKLLKKGIGYEVPAINSMVTVNLVGYYQTSDERIHKFDERQNLKFRLSEGCESGVVRGLEYALYKMKVMEKNRVYILRKYSFGQDCKLEHLAEHLTSADLGQLSDHRRLVYEVELVSFETRKLICAMSIGERFDLCETEKIRGADYFKQDKFHLSLKCYSDILKAIGPPDTLPDLSDKQKSMKTEFVTASYNNMSLCYLKLKMPKEALKYADWCLQLDPTNLKALYRKGLANYDRNDFKQSIELFNRCLELDPDNKAAKNQINLAERQIKKYENKEKQVFSNLFQVLANDREIQAME